MARSQRGRDKVEKLRRALFRYKWDMAETVIRQIPEGCLLPSIHVDQEQWSVLHVAAMVNAPAPLIQKILAVVNVEFCMQKDANGNNPLHRICKNGSDIDAIRLLALARPQSLYEANTDERMTPFDYIVGVEDRFSSHDIARLVTDVAAIWAEGMYTVNIHGESLLHRVVRHSLRRNDVSVAKAILDAAPELLEKTDENGKTPIHHAVHDAVRREEYNATAASLVEFLVGRGGDQSGLDLTDSSGRTPLHEACATGLQRDMIEILVKTYPDALEITDEKGLTPLALFRRRRRKFQGREMLAADCAMTLMTGAPLRCTDSPSLHSLLRNEYCTMDIVRYLVTAMPEQVSVKDENGDLPLHFICSTQNLIATSSDCLGEVVQRLLYEYPAACRITNHDGLLPLELMARSGKVWSDGMWIVFLEHPAAMMDLGLNSHSLCAVLEKLGKESSPNAMFRLLKDAPDLL